MSDATTQQWVEDALAGDQDAFAEIVYAHEDAVFNLCYRMLNQRQEAEDAAQETFLRAYVNLHRYDMARSLKTWLLSIASNHCIDRIRRRRLNYLSLDEPLPSGDPMDFPGDEPGPERVAILRENTAAVQELLDALSPEYRAAVVLRYWYDYSYDEIADALDTTESAVKSRLFRARRALAERLETGGTSRPTDLTGGLRNG